MLPELALHLSPWFGTVVLYLATGLAWITLDPLALPVPWTAPSRPGCACTAAVVVLCALLWPAAVLVRLVRARHSARARRTARLRTPDPGAPRTRTHRAAQPGERAAAGRAPVPARVHAHAPGDRANGAPREDLPEASVYAPGTEAAGVPERFVGWVRVIRRAIEEGCRFDAVLSVQHLVLEVERVHGPSSHHLWAAIELQAHVCHVIGDDDRAVQLYLRAVEGWARGFGIDHPAARAAWTRAQALATSASQLPPATRLLLLTWSRLFQQGQAAPTTAATPTARRDAGPAAAA